MQHQATPHTAKPTSEDTLIRFLEAACTAKDITEVNIAAGIALNEYRGVDLEQAA